MDLNPLADMVEQAKKKQFDNKILGIQQDITQLKGAIMSKSFIELNTLGDMDESDKISINPEYIQYIKEDGDHAYVRLSDGTSFHTVESRDVILKLILGKQTIG